ncbi:hypothetical protein Tco_0856950 [Tanacetum coccineum]|uniref:Uncharacterized protein n=1 Tax=Tanacetum coccineum TaxID=301880 RepID=A0ABQ5B5W6_9ASTR
MPTEMELTLEQTQQGVSYEVSNIRVNSFTMKMEILLEPTSNKLMVVPIMRHVEYVNLNTYVLENSILQWNPGKKILLKLNLSDHMSILTDPLCKMVVETCAKSLKLKIFNERCNIKLFQEWYAHVVQKSQVHKMAKFSRDA